MNSEIQAKFITHPDFENVLPINVFHKETSGRSPKETDAKFLNRHFVFRKSFNLTATEDAILKITADDYFRLYVNGVFVTSGPAPSYPSAYYYATLDITPYLNEGDNLIAVHTYYQGLINRVWVSGDRRSMLIASLTVGGKTVLSTDESWRCHSHTAYSPIHTIGYETAFTERYDSRSAECGFENKDFDDSAWEFARVAKGADHTLIPQPTEQLTYYKVAPVSVQKTDTGTVIDFGQEMVGTLSARAHGKEGDTVIIYSGEELNVDGSVRYNLRCNCIYHDEWILSGGNDTLDQFDYKGMRYCELIIPEGVTVDEIYMSVRHYPFEEKAVFSSLTPDEERIIELCRNTVKYAMQENFVDCPTREKGQYLGDVSIAARAHAVLTGDTSMMKKAVRDFLRSSFICPGIMAVAPSSYMQETADYSLQLPASTLWVYKTDGDIDFLRECEPKLTGILDYFKQYIGDDGLIAGVVDKWNLVDWPKNLRDNYEYEEYGGEKHNVLNAFFCGMLSAMDEIYEILGMEKTGLTDRAKKSFVEAFYSESDGLFKDNVRGSHISLHSNILPLLFDIGTEDNALTERLISYIAERTLASSGVYMAYFALAALKLHGRYDLARSMISEEKCWLNMLNEGGTTAFEAWGKDQKWNTSLCHPWTCAPIIILCDDAIPY